MTIARALGLGIAMAVGVYFVASLVADAMFVWPPLRRRRPRRTGGRS